MYVEVSYKGNWYPICGHYFWDNDHGASTLCKQLGFNSGKQSKTRAKFSVDAMPVGKCGASQRLNKCSLGGNAWGNFSCGNGWCKKGTSIGVTVRARLQRVYVYEFLDCGIMSWCFAARTDKVQRRQWQAKQLRIYRSA